MSKNIGDFGESIAEKFLQEKWYSICDKNFRVYGGEIDIIAKKDEIFYFIEVKYRENADFVHPLELFDFRKKKPFLRAFYEYISLYDIDEENCQIDLIAILPNQTGHKIFHKKWVEIESDIDF